jgi:hypothetical protein
MAYMHSTQWLESIARVSRRKTRVFCPSDRMPCDSAERRAYVRLGLASCRADRWRQEEARRKHTFKNGVLSGRITRRNATKSETPDAVQKRERQPCETSGTSSSDMTAASCSAHALVSKEGKSGKEGEWPMHQISHCISLLQHATPDPAQAHGEVFQRCRRGHAPDAAHPDSYDQQSVQSSYTATRQK